MRVAFVTYVIALLFSVTLFAAPPPSVILSRSDAHTPIFISASAMVAADGTTAAVVPQDWRQQQQQVAQAFSQHSGEVSAFGAFSATPCHGAMMVESPLESPVNRTTQHDAVVNAHAIVAGTIRSVTPGFFFGTPGSLVELGSLDKIKLDAAYGGVSDNLYLRLPYAHFESGGIEYCRETGAASYAPRVGDRLLVFAYDWPLDATGTLVYSTSSDVIAQPSGGSLRIPKAFSFFENPTATIESVLLGIRYELSRHEQPVVNPHGGRVQ